MKYTRRQCTFQNSSYSCFKLWNSVPVLGNLTQWKVQIDQVKIYYSEACEILLDSSSILPYDLKITCVWSIIPNSDDDSYELWFVFIVYAYDKC